MCGSDMCYDENCKHTLLSFSIGSIGIHVCSCSIIRQHGSAVYIYDNVGMVLYNYGMYLLGIDN